MPSIALEAVLLRPQNEKINLLEALDELLRSSFIDQIPADVRDETEVSVPLAARLFAMRKLETSPWRASIQADSELLYLFGVGHAADGKASLEPRIRKLFNNVASLISQGKRTLEEVEPILRHVASRYSIGWILLADLLTELNGSNDQTEAIKCLTQYIENPDPDYLPVSKVWQRIVHLKRAMNDLKGELHALAQLCRNPDVDVDALSDSANQINRMFKTTNLLTELGLDEKRFILTSVSGALRDRLSDLSATDASRLAWIYIHLD